MAWEVYRPEHVQIVCLRRHIIVISVWLLSFSRPVEEDGVADREMSGTNAVQVWNGPCFWWHYYRIFCLVSNNSNWERMSVWISVSRSVWDLDRLNILTKTPFERAECHWNWCKRMFTHHDPLLHALMKGSESSTKLRAALPLHTAPTISDFGETGSYFMVSWLFLWHPPTALPQLSVIYGVS